MELRKRIKWLFWSTFTFLSLAVGLFATIVLIQVKPAIFEAYLVDPANWRAKNIRMDLPKGERGKLIKYGHKLVSETPKWMGPDSDDDVLKFTGNHLSCTNCHLEGGTKRGAAAWIGISQRFPQFKGRENRNVTLKDRVNGCMERSMNGKKLPEESTQMEAIIAYMDWLSEGVPEEISQQYTGFPEIAIPNVKADLVKGKEIYTVECQTCHGEDGAGIKTANNSTYQFPPLWGQDTYNHGAGMNRVLTAAQFIKGNMPFGQATYEQPKLSDEEAFHVAAYINSFSRPVKQFTEQDFPDLVLKPVSTPYGPWADDFSEEQHKYGPFPPIISYYKDKHGITKKK